MIKIDLICNLFDHGQHGYFCRALAKYLHGKVDLGLPRYGSTVLPGITTQDDMIFFSQFAKPNRVPDVNIFVDYPVNWGPSPSSKNIGIMAWPTTRLSSRPINVPNSGINPHRYNFVSVCNSMDEVWVFGQFAQKTCETSGVKKPIKVIRPLVNCNQWSPNANETTRGILNVTNTDTGKEIPKSERKFVVGTVLEWTRRHNIEAFISTTMVGLPHDKGIVVIKVNRPPNVDVNASRAEATDYISKIKTSLKVPLLPPIVFIDDLMTEEDLRGLIKTFDLYISTSRGEGVDYHALYAMAMGKPVIAPNHTWYSESLKTGVNSILVPAVPEIVRMADEPWLQGDQAWGTVDEIELVKTIRALYETWESNGHDLSKIPITSNARGEITGNYDTHISGGRILKAIEALYKP